MKRIPSIADLHRLFECRDGVLVRRVTQSQKARAGMIAGNLAGTGYLQVMALGAPLLVHRVVWAMTHGAWPTHKIDHINGCRTDNRPENLREATQSQNLMNRGACKSNRLGVKGVSMTASGKYAVRVSKDRKTSFIGTFDSLDVAKGEYALAAKRLHGDFYPGANV